MISLKIIWSEFFGLFVDDGSFAIAILLWLAAVRLLLPRLGLPSTASGLILFIGLVVILIDSATRRARGSRGI